MSYIKKIHYLDYYENGNKGKALGHIVWKEHEGKCELYVSVSKLERLFMGQASVLLLFQDSVQSVGVLEVQGGYAEKEIYIGYLKHCPMGVRIAMTPSKWLETTWLNNETKPVNIPASEVEMTKVSVEPKKEAPQYKDDILSGYPICHPFGDDEAYYSAQIDVLQKIQVIKKLENNSFLLHGYYNYKHLIVKKNHNGHIILGVPGVYYEREKKVAAMYGFDKFKGVKSAESIGSFGYYLKNIER